MRSTERPSSCFCIIGVVFFYVIVEQNSKKLSLSSSQSGGSTLEELAHDSSSAGRLIPAFVRTCIEYIEQEGIMSEGLYRVPGNRAHVDQLVEILRLGILMQCLNTVWLVVVVVVAAAAAARNCSTCSIKERKSIVPFIYYVYLKALRHGSHSFACKLHHACLSFISVHQMAPPLTEVADIQLQLTTHLSIPKR